MERTDRGSRHTSDHPAQSVTSNSTSGNGGGGRGRARQVTEQLRRAIITGVLAPGARLTEDRVAEEYHVSRIPVREAFRALEVEGFVNIEPYSGTFVASMSDQDAQDLLEVRQAIEVLAAGRAAIRRTEAQLSELEGIIDGARAALAAGDHAALVSLNGRFHLVMAQASGNETIEALLLQLQAKIEWVYAREIQARATDSWDEHVRIVDALRAGDPLRASMLVQAHITNAELAYRRRADG